LRGLTSKGRKKGRGKRQEEKKGKGKEMGKSTPQQKFRLQLCPKPTTGALPLDPTRELSPYF